MISTRNFASVGEAGSEVMEDFSLDEDSLAPDADPDDLPPYSGKGPDGPEGTDFEEDLGLDEWDTGAGFLEMNSDPVKLRRRGVGRNPMLSFDQEGEPSLKVRCSKYLQSLEQHLAERNGKTPGPLDTYLEVLRRIARAAPLALAFSQQLELSPPLTLSDLRYDPVLRANLDRQISPEIVSTLAASLGEDADVLRQQLAELSLSSLLLPPEVAMNAGNCPVEELGSLLELPAFLDMPAEHVTAYQSHFRRIAWEGDLAQTRMVKANLQLVISLAGKYLDGVRVV